MSSFRRSVLVGVLLAAIDVTLGWAGETVNTWVDSEGVRHFSQFPPAENVQQLETLELDTPPPAVPLDERLEAIRAVSRDLELARQQREEKREKPAEKTATPDLPNQQSESGQDNGIRILPYPYYTPYPPRYPYAPAPPYRHDRRPSPDTEKPRPHSLIPRIGGSEP